MKRIIIIFAGTLLSVFLALFFFLTPSQVISKINDLQHAVVFSALQANGNLVAGYRFTNASLSGINGTKLLSFDEVMLDLHLSRLFFGHIGMDIDSKEINAAFSVGLDGNIKGDANFTNLPLDTTAFIPDADISFIAPISGKVIVSDRKADIEVRADQITWKRLSVAGMNLPLDIFEKGRGGISVQENRIIVKSVAFDGNKGYARLSGEISSRQRLFMLELFPKDWDDFTLAPLHRYMVSPGQYKIPLGS